MAIKEQCSRCTQFNVSADTCCRTGSVPHYDNHSCEFYSREVGNINLSKRIRINLDKDNDPVSAASSMPIPSTSTLPYAPSQQTGAYNPNINGNTTPGKMFSHPFSFNGRIRRLEYCLSYIIYIVWDVIYSAVLETDSSFGIALCLISLVPASWFIYAQGAKRCHDRDNSGWYQLIPFYVFWMMFADGDSGQNTYGPNPKK